MNNDRGTWFQKIQTFLIIHKQKIDTNLCRWKFKLARKKTIKLHAHFFSSEKMKGRRETR